MWNNAIFSEKPMLLKKFEELQRIAEPEIKTIKKPG